tara:strand:- start:680 stop:856 length:177 start_codon:yes stop_codon:yes gene_type:complete
MKPLALAAVLIFLFGLSGYLYMATIDPHSFTAFCLSLFMPISLIIMLILVKNKKVTHQ